MIFSASHLLWRKRSLILGFLILSALLGGTVAMMKGNIYQATSFLKPAGNFEEFYADFTAIPKEQAFDRLYKKPSILGDDFTITVSRPARMIMLSYKALSPKLAQTSNNIVLENYMRLLEKKYVFNDFLKTGKKVACSDYLLDSKTENKFDECLHTKSTNKGDNETITYRRAEEPKVAVYGYFREIMILSLLTGLLVGIFACVAADIVQRHRQKATHD